jgi:hypothetical protein
VLANTPDPAALDRELRDRLRGYRIVFEMGLDSETISRSGEAVRRIARGLTKSGSHLLASYPAVLLAYLVGESNARYDGALWKNLPVKGLDRDELADAFEQAIAALDLEPFAQAALEGHRYVTPILAHGGIPQFSAHDFWTLLFDGLDALPGADADELVTNWFADPNAFDRIDKPVVRFLKYGGKVARDFIQRCVHLASAAPDDQAAGLDLPRYLVDAYKRERERDTERGASPGVRLARPRITLDPWSHGGPVLELPPVSAVLAKGEWVVIADQTKRRLATSSREPTEVPLLPAERWIVEYQSGDLTRPFSFDGSAAGAMIFDPITGSYRPVAHAIELSEAWLLVSPGAQVTVERTDGTSKSLDEVSPLVHLAGAWGAHRLLQVSLEDASWLVMRRDRGDRPELRVEVVDASKRPVLLDRPVDGVATESGHDIYAKAPSLRVPQLAGAGYSRWAIAVRTPESLRHASTADLETHNGVLDLAALLPSEYLGTVDVAVRGPLGRDLDASFGVVPELAIELPKGLVLPGESSDVLIFTSPSTFIDGSAGGALERVVAPNETFVVCVLTLAGRDFAIRIAVPKLTWSLQGELPTSPGTDAALIDLDDLRERVVDALLVATQRPDVPVSLALLGRDAVLVRTPTSRTSTKRGLWRWPLGQFTDSIVASDEAMLELQLDVGGHAVTVARVVAQVHASAFRSQVKQLETGRSLVLRWSEEHALRGRTVVLWPLDPPHSAPLSPATADSVRAEATFSPDDVPPGRYRAQATIADAWAPPQRPERGAPSTGEMFIEGTPDAGVTSADLLRRSLRDVSRPGDLTDAAISEVADELLRALLQYNLESDKDDEWRRSVFSAQLLFSSPSVGLRALSASASDTNPFAAVGVLAAGVTRDAAMPAVREQDWRSCAPLAARSDIAAAWRGDAAALRRCKSELGWTPNQGLPPATSGIGAGGWNSMTSAEVLRWIGRPGPLLASEMYQDANAQWIAAAQDDRLILDRWWEEHGAVVLVERAPDLIQLYARLRAPVTAELPRFVALPQATLLLASAVVTSGPNWSRAARALVQAAAFAPRLVTQDLCLAIVIHGLPEDEVRKAAIQGVQPEPALRESLARNRVRSHRETIDLVRSAPALDEEQLLRALQTWWERKVIALQRRTWQFTLISARNLALIAQQRPSTQAELAAVIGASAAAEYSQDILSIVSSASVRRPR